MDYLKNFFPVGANSVVVDTLSRFLLAFNETNSKTLDVGVWHYSVDLMKAMIDYNETGDVDQFQDSIEELIIKLVGPKKYLAPKPGYFPYYNPYLAYFDVVYFNKKTFVVTKVFRGDNNTPMLEILSKDGENLTLPSEQVRKTGKIVSTNDPGDFVFNNSNYKILRFR